MSHWTTVTVEVNDREVLKKVLKKLGLSYQEGMGAKLKMTGYRGAEMMVDMTIDYGNPRNPEYKVGMVFNTDTGKTDIVADWWGLCTAPEKFTKDVIAPYAEQVTVDHLTAEGYVMLHRQKTNNGVELIMAEPL